MIDSKAQAKEQIPHAVWSDVDFFNSDISDEIISFTRLKEEDAFLKVFSTKFDEWDEQQKCCLVLAITYAYPEISIQRLLMIHGFLRLDTAQSLVIFALLGNKEYLDEFMRGNHSVSSLNLGEYGMAIIKATANGQRQLNDTIAQLANHVSDRLTSATGYLPDGYRYKDRLFSHKKLPPKKAPVSSEKQTSSDETARRSFTS